MALSGERTSASSARRARADQGALDLTILRPGRLTDEPGTGRVRLGHGLPFGQVPRDDVAAVDVFACVDAAFAQRRKTLRAALAGWAGSAAHAEEILRAAGIDPTLRGERLPVDDFAALAAARSA